MTRHTWLGAAALSACALLTACSGASSSAGAGPSHAATSSVGTPSQSPQQQAAIRLSELLAEEQLVTTTNVVRASSSFADWHRAEVALANACHTVVDALRAGPWPADAQASITEFADAKAASCRYADQAAKAGSLRQLRSVPGAPDAVRDRLTAAKLAACTALGV